MNEEERASQVSALFDGELDASQSDLVLRRILKDPAQRAAWGRYAIIGASMRGEPLSVGALGRDDIASRVAGALALEPELAGPVTAVPSASSSWRSGAYKAVWGTALAASVAAASLLVLRMQGVPQPGAMAGAQMAQAAQAQPAVAIAQTAPVEAARAPLSGEAVATGSGAPSYTTPVGTPSNAGLPAPLVNYVVAHSEYLAPVMRFNPLSAVMMGTFEPGEELVEATEAEIGASRR